MKKITDFTKLGKQGYAELRADMEKALESVAKKYGVTFKTGNAGHLETYCDMKITISVDNGTGNSKYNKEAAIFKANAKAFGLSADDLGREFISQGEAHKLVGMTARGEYCMLAERKDGKVFKFKPASIVQMFKNIAVCQ